MHKSLRWRIWTVYFYFAARPTVVFFGRVLFYFLPLPLFSRCVAGGWRARDLEGRGDGRTYTHSPERFRRAPFNTNNNNVRACPCLSARLRVNRPGKNPRYTKGKTRETLNSPPPPSSIFRPSHSSLNTRFTVDIFTFYTYADDGWTGLVRRRFSGAALGTRGLW